MTFRLQSEEREYEIRRDGEGICSINGESYRFDVSRLGVGHYSLLVEGLSYEVFVSGSRPRFSVEIAGNHFCFIVNDPSLEVVTEVGGAVVRSPMAGRVISLKVSVGEDVSQGQGLIIVEAMKMENELQAPRSGRVSKILVKTGDAVENGQELAVIE